MTVLVNEAGEPTPRVLVAVPCGTTVDAYFAQDLALMFAYTTYVKPDMEVLSFFARGTYLPRARAALVNKAVEKSCTHILWLDTDMRFPKDTLLRLLSHGKHVVAANYSTRQAPIIPIAVDEEKQPIFESKGLKEARSAPMGVMMTRTDVFLAMPKPYFAIGYSKAIDDYSPEDSFFCELARKHSYAIWIDGELSEQVRHVGTFEYEMGHARMTRDAAQPEES